MRFAPPRGFVVVQLTPAQVDGTLCDAQGASGGRSAFCRRSRPRLSRSSLCSRLIAKLERAKTPDEVATLNRRLHETIVAAAHNQYLHKMANVLNDALGLLGTTTYSTAGRIQKAA